MRHAAALSLLPFTLLLAQPSQAQMVTISPEQIGQIFCIGSLGNNMAPVETLLSPGLQSVIAEAWQMNAAFEHAHPGEKPPLGDGLPWRSYPDYADGCTVGTIAGDANRMTVEIRYTFKDYPDADYIDGLVLIPAADQSGVWQIDDIDLIDEATMRTYLAAPLYDAPTN